MGCTAESHPEDQIERASGVNIQKTNAEDFVRSGDNSTPSSHEICLSRAWASFCGPASLTFSSSSYTPGAVPKIGMRQQPIIAAHLAADPDGYAVLCPGLGDIATSGAVVWIGDRHGRFQLFD